MGIDHRSSTLVDTGAVATISLASTFAGFCGDVDAQLASSEVVATMPKSLVRLFNCRCILEVFRLFWLAF